jgi:hypothetical protein
VIKKFDDEVKSIPRTLLLGAELLFSTRLNELISRYGKVTKYNFKVYLNDDSRPYFDFSDLHDVEGLILLNKITCVVMTSELLFFLQNNNQFQFFITFVTRLKNRNIVRFIFISITSPLVGDVNLLTTKVTVMPDAIYTRRLNETKSMLDLTIDTIFELSSYYTYNKSKLQANPIHQILNVEHDSQVISDYDVFFCDNSADELISSIINNYTKVGYVNIDRKSQLNLGSFIDNLRNVFNKSQAESYSPTLSSSNTEFSSNFDSTDQSIVRLFNQSHCALNSIYRMRPNESLQNVSVASFRSSLGEKLANFVPTNILNRIDIIVPVPETGKHYAQGLANALAVPYIEAIYKKIDVGRGFDIGNFDKRKAFIRSKLGLIEDLVEGKNIAIVDEAIFTGATLKIVCEMLIMSPVNEIYILIPTPECKNQCNYNMQPDRTLLAEYIRPSDMASYFNVNGVFFQNLGDFEGIMSRFQYYCAKCFGSNADNQL